MLPTLQLILTGAAQIVFVMLLAPLLTGVINKIKARFQLRQGPPLLQSYFDLAKLLMKGSVRSSTASWIFDIAPVVNFTTSIVAAAALPMLSGQTVFGMTNIIVFVGIFTIGRFFLSLASLDTASSFGGIGSSREMLLSSFIEPAIILIVLFLSVSASGATTISGLAGFASSPAILVSLPSRILAAIALLMLIFAEMKRMPFDNPATHLELTMVHEAMILENSGPSLALMEWSASIKFLILCSLFALLFTPISLLWTNPFLAVCAFTLTALVISIVLAVVEARVIKVRLFKVADILMFALVLSLISFVSLHYKVEGLQQIFEASCAMVMLVSSIFFLLVATFRRRVKIFVINSITLSLIFLTIAIFSPGFDSYFRLSSTIILQVIIAPLLLYFLFNQNIESKEAGPHLHQDITEKRGKSYHKLLVYDPVFMSNPMPTVVTLSIVAAIVIVSFSTFMVLGSTNLLVPLAISIILIGFLIVAIKTHVLLQLFGLLILENGITLLSVALSIYIPFLSEAVTLFDAIVLIAVAVALSMKVGRTVGTMDTRRFDKIDEGEVNA